MFGVGHGPLRPPSAASEAKITARIGENIRLRRQQLHLSQVEVAEYCGCSHQQIQKYESGKCAITASRLFVLAEILEAPLSFFSTGGHAPRPAERRTI
jgi:transcriptional regulator with XRE-family HTH domain